MKLHTKLFTASFISVLALNISNYVLAQGNESSNDSKTSKATSQVTQDISQTLKSNSNLSKFASHAKSTGLDKTLKGKGPYTVFAPSDKAFDKLTDEQKKALANPENLKKVLKHHVVAHKALATKNIKEKMNVPTMAEEYLVLETSKDGKKIVGGALIKEEDIKCKNGVVHVIDEVLFPAEENTKEASGKNSEKSTTEPSSKSIDKVEPAQAESKPATDPTSSESNPQDKDSSSSQSMDESK